MSEENKKCPKCNSEMVLDDFVWICSNTLTCGFIEYFVCFNCPKSDESEMIYKGSDGEGTYRYECPKCNNIILHMAYCTKPKKSEKIIEKRICIGNKSDKEIFTGKKVK